MKSLQTIIPAGLTMLAIVAIISSCQKTEVPEPFQPDRMFTPASIKVASGDTTGTITWAASLFSEGTGVTYTLEVSRAKDFSGTPAFTTQTPATTYTVTESNLATRVYYYARVKANATTNAAASKGWVVSLDSFLLTGEQLFLPVNDAKLTALTAVLNWKVTAGLTKIVLTPSGGAATDYTLSAGELTAGEKAFTGLQPAKQYKAELFKGTISKGITNFTTKSGPPSGATTVNVAPTDDLAALIAAATPGTVFLLQQGTVYKTDALINLPANAEIAIWGDHGPNKPVLAFNGFNLPTTAGTIRFENIDLTGLQNNDPAGTKRNYIFNQSTASATEAIVFENCTIRNFLNTPLRLQGSNAITINKATFNKCLVYDCGDNGSNGTYAFINTNVATGKINNISITNSTLYKIGYGIILHNAAPSQSVVIDNCTFDNTVGNARFFIDYNAQAISGTFQISNIIIGKTLSPAATGRGVRSASTPTVSNSFRTSDAAFVDFVPAGITSYSGNSAALFTDPTNGNFLIKDNTFAGKSTSGDPRWRL